MTNVEKLLTAWFTSFQDVENCLQQLVTERSVDTAVGKNLDAIGRIVGQERLGLSDDLYRRVIRAKISVNRSRGRINDVIRVARCVVSDPDADLHWDNQGAAAGVLRIGDVTITHDVAATLISLLRKTVSAGVRAILEYTHHTPVSDVALWSTHGSWGSSLWARAID